MSLFAPRTKRASHATLLYCLLACCSIRLHAEVTDNEVSVNPEPRQFEELPITESDRDHWSFQAIKQPSLPSVMHHEWPTNGLDYFILDQMEASNLKPANEADRLVLLRRLKLDLLGIPPTLEELDAFETDPSPDAYDRWVDRFLASPRYGERWSQPWLDLARFAETDGFEHDRVRKDAWRYRDWVIQSLNDDMPYHQFVSLQLAGDVGEDQTQKIATMFCLAGPDMPDLNDQELRRHDRLNELTSMIGSALLGLQFHCAQCHDHKNDPISQADFYRFRAVFEPSVPTLERDEPFNIFRSEDSTIEAKFYFRGDLQQTGPTVRAALPRIATDPTQEIQYCESSSPRAELAKWLFQENNPLTARVIVNRLWQTHFGRGLFENPSDVGVAAASPTHPELLDWLATELRRNNWNLKAIQRTMVTSSTYRQQSYASPNDVTWQQRLDKDLSNRLYSRYPRHRLDAEVIRDSMLAATGRLNFECGGESVMPPLPDELLETLLKGQWKTSKDEADYWRRSIYIFARRNLRYPIFESFDRPDAGFSCAKRDLSTTAIQALQMLNSELSIECSKHLSDRILGEAKTDADPNATPSIEYQIERLVALTLGRRATERDQVLFQKFMQEVDSDTSMKLHAACLSVLNTNEFIYID